MNFLRLRADSHAQYEIRVYSDAMAESVKKVAPFAWEAFQDYVVNGMRFSRIEKSLLEKKLPLPAYDQCLKASHIFNLLDARGVIGVAQRTEYISRIRELAKGSGQSWLESQK